ncbi:hypothetical protein [Tsukamurella strandjordii]|uniref:Uncharacterized protein n=1 Tax=Tsukamurella strandjordii TaxID=147577 RepID=A0AA90NE82_9ACTN|nr:hypothetical protein [Tsukamurella strandjordii]MDP0396810.1 hypothetical protein [Tsukamurella strandjordii]
MESPNPSSAKPRPGATGIWVGAAMMLLAVIVPVVATVTVVLPQFRLDMQTVPADGAPHSVTVPADRTYAVFAETRTTVGAPSCTLTTAGGAPIEQRVTGGNVTVSNRMVLSVFETGAGDVVATCSPGMPEAGGAEVALGRYPDMGLLLGGIFGSLGFALVVGGLGLTVLIVSLVRRRK